MQRPITISAAMSNIKLNAECVRMWDGGEDHVILFQTLFS